MDILERPQKWETNLPLDEMEDCFKFCGLLKKPGPVKQDTINYEYFYVFSTSFYALQYLSKNAHENI